VAALSLAYVHKITEKPIRLAKEKKLKEALAKVLPEFDEIKSSRAMPLTGKDSVTIYTAFKDGLQVGTAIDSYTNKGFSGYIEVMVGFDNAGKIVNTAVLQHTETPGLGTKMDASKSNFPLQFNGKDPAKYKLKVKKDGGDVDAITAATISSRAFCDATRRAYDVLKKEGGIEK